MMNAIVISFRFILANIKKILLVLLLTLVFIFLLFPLSDLNDWASSQVSKLTQNRVYLQFEQLHLNPFNVTLGMDDVLVETPQISGLTAGKITASPSLMAAFKRKPGGTLTAENLFKGDIEVHITPTPTDGGIDKSRIELTARNISLKEVRDVAQLNLPITGQLNLTSTALADLTLAEQPDVDVNLTIQKFELASTTVSTAMMGSVNVPQIRFDRVELKGKLVNGKFTIESGKLGNNKDDLYGDIKGDIGLTFANVQGQVVPQIGAYNVSVDLKANQNFQQRASLFLSFLDSSKTMQGSSANYKFRISGDPMGMPFNLTPIR